MAAPNQSLWAVDWKLCRLRKQGVATDKRGFAVVVWNAFRRDASSRMRRWRWLSTAAVAALTIVSSVVPSSAESILDALAAAYSSSPRIKAEQARLRASDEELARAQSGYRPTIQGSATATALTQATDPSVPTDGDVLSRNYGLTLNQSIFDGFQTSSSVKEADAQVKANRESLRGIEQQILLDAVKAYVDVVRDIALQKLREGNVSSLATELRATQDRFAVGEVTKTDVAQARASQAAAQAALGLAKANLKASLADFERAVGHAPGNLSGSGNIERFLPVSLRAAIEIGMTEHPDVVSAAFLAESTRYSIDKIKGELLPSISLQASYRKSLDPTLRVDEQEQASVTGQLVVPFYQGGEVEARIRQAKENEQGRVLDIERARETVRSQVVAAWSQLEAARSQLAANEVQVSSAQTALDGVKEEEQVGQRTLIDVLNAQQDLVNAQVARANTRRDLVFAGYQVLATIGRLTANDLHLAVELYDAQKHYDDTNGKWWGTAIEHEQGYDGVTDQRDIPEPGGWQSNVISTLPGPAPEGDLEASGFVKAEPVPDIAASAAPAAAEKDDDWGGWLPNFN